MNKLKPGIIQKINVSGGDYKMMDNISQFQRAAVHYGIADVDLFNANDLWDQKNIALVTQTIFGVARQVWAFIEESSRMLYINLPQRSCSATNIPNGKDLSWVHDHQSWTKENLPKNNWELGKVSLDCRLEQTRVQHKLDQIWAHLVKSFWENKCAFELF